MSRCKNPGLPPGRPFAMTATRLESREALCETLGVTWKQITGILHGRKTASYYTNFEIPKRSGGVRTISAPHGSLLLLQQKLADILQDYYEPRHSTQGYVRGRSIGTNARQPVGRRRVLNVDLTDFFPTITYARIYGTFKAKPFDLPDELAGPH